MEQTLITKIIDFLFGKKYYANIINTRGTNVCQITSFIHCTKADAEAHKRTIQAGMSFIHIETISFRSRVDYQQIKE